MEYLEQWADYLRAVEGRSPRTVDQYRGMVRRMGRAMGVEDPAELSFELLERHLRELYTAGLSTATRAARVSAVRSYCSYLVARGILATSPARDLRRPRVYEREAPVLTVPEVQGLIYGPIARGLERSAWAVRDRTLLGVMYVLGLRSSEPGRLGLQDLVWSEEVAVFSVRIRGAKWQDRDMRLWLDEDVSRLVGAYVEGVHAAVGGGAMLFPGRGSADRGLSRSAVGRIFDRRVKEAGIRPKGRRLSPHILRHSIATHLLDAGVNPRKVQRHMRHRSLETTMRYLHTDSAAMVKEWRKRHPIKTHQRRERAVSMHRAVRQWAQDLQDLAPRNSE